MNEKITISDIAGFCPEEAVWKMLADVCIAAQEGRRCSLSPDSIIYDGDTFVIEETSEKPDSCTAPEAQGHATTDEPQMVWSIGAVSYYAATGRQLFGGRGSAYQREHPSVELPTLPKKFQRMSSLIQSCLDANPSKRPSIKDIAEQAQKGLASHKFLHPTEHTVSQRTIQKDTTDPLGDKWPEEMAEV